MSVTSAGEAPQAQRTEYLGPDPADVTRAGLVASRFARSKGTCEKFL